MVHPGIVVAGVLGVVVTGVVIYTILKEEIDEFLESFEKPSLVGASGGGRHRQQQQQQQQRDQHQQRRFSHNDNFQDGAQSSSVYQPDYELRQRRRPDEEDEKDPDHDILMERLRRINESEANIAASEARLAALERAMREREEQLERDLQELKTREQQQSSELYRNPFEAHEPLIRDYNVNDSQDLLIPDESGAKVDTRTAHAILRHDLSSNHQENINPFEDPSTLISNASSSARSSVHGDDDAFVDAEDRRSTTPGSHLDDEEDFDWTDAEVGSVGSHDSDDSWESP